MDEFDADHQLPLNVALQTTLLAAVRFVTCSSHAFLLTADL